jgi:hypothetical protein
MKKTDSILFLLILTIVHGHASVNLSGNYLSISALEHIKDGKAFDDLRKQLNKTTDHQQQAILQKKIELYQTMRRFISWQCTIPTTGLSSVIPEYPYIPHFFSLWELAPKKGRGITIAFVDTGIAGFEIEGQSYKKHPDLTISENYIGDLLNFSNRAGFEALLWYIRQCLPHEMAQQPLEQEVIIWINEYCISKSVSSITKFFKNAAIPQSKLEQIIKEITQGRRGIMPYNKARFFTPVQLIAPINRKVIFEFLSIAPAKSEYLQASHGTHIYGLVNAQSIGLAPHAECLMIKLCKEDGTTDKETLIHALKRVQYYNPDIINISLKIDGTLADTFMKEFHQLFDESRYVVTASGNATESMLSQQAYPARCAHIDFDVGSFSYDGNNEYPISSFSQYQLGVGPKFVAPGMNILSTGYSYNNNQQEPGYLFLSGTSMSSALMSGFVALMLAEFKDDFTREQLLTVCYSSTIKMHETLGWDKKCTLGVLDMRTALLILHICKAFKKTLNQKSHTFDFEKNFKGVVKTLGLILFEMPRDFALLHSISYDFAHSFAEFYKNIPLKKCSYKKQSVEKTASEFTDLLFALVDRKNKQAHCSFIIISDYLFAKLRGILLNSNVSS